MLVRQNFRFAAPLADPCSSSRHGQMVAEIARTGSRAEWVTTGTAQRLSRVPPSSRARTILINRSCQMNELFGVAYHALMGRLMQVSSTARSTP